MCLHIHIVMFLLWKSGLRINSLTFSFEILQNTIHQLTAQNAELQEMLRNVENGGSMEPSGTESMLELLTNCNLIFCTEF